MESVVYESDFKSTQQLPTQCVSFLEHQQMLFVNTVIGVHTF